MVLVTFTGLFFAIKAIFRKIASPVTSVYYCTIKNYYNRSSFANNIESFSKKNQIELSTNKLPSLKWRVSCAIQNGKKFHHSNSTTFDAQKTKETLRTRLSGNTIKDDLNWSNIHIQHFFSLKWLLPKHISGVKGWTPNVLQRYVPYECHWLWVPIKLNFRLHFTEWENQWQQTYHNRRQIGTDFKISCYKWIFSVP